MKKRFTLRRTLDEQSTDEDIEYYQPETGETLDRDSPLPGAEQDEQDEETAWAATDAVTAAAGRAVRRSLDIGRRLAGKLKPPKPSLDRISSGITHSNTHADVSRDEEERAAAAAARNGAGAAQQSPRLGKRFSLGGGFTGGEGSATTGGGTVFKSIASVFIRGSGAGDQASGPQDSNRRPGPGDARRFGSNRGSGSGSKRISTISPTGSSGRLNSGGRGSIGSASGGPSSGSRVNSGTRHSGGTGSLAAARATAPGSPSTAPAAGGSTPLTLKQKVAGKLGLPTSWLSSVGGEAAAAVAPPPRGGDGGVDTDSSLHGGVAPSASGDLQVVPATMLLVPMEVRQRLMDEAAAGGAADGTSGPIRNASLRHYLQEIQYGSVSGGTGGGFEASSGYASLKIPREGEQQPVTPNRLMPPNGSSTRHGGSADGGLMPHDRSSNGPVDLADSAALGPSESPSRTPSAAGPSAQPTQYGNHYLSLHPGEPQQPQLQPQGPHSMQPPTLPTKAPRVPPAQGSNADLLAQLQQQLSDLQEMQSAGRGGGSGGGSGGAAAGSAAPPLPVRASSGAKAASQSLHNLNGDLAALMAHQQGDGGSYDGSSGAAATAAAPKLVSQLSAPAQGVGGPLMAGGPDRRPSSATVGGMLTESSYSEACSSRVGGVGGIGVVDRSSSGVVGGVGGGGGAVVAHPISSSPGDSSRTSLNGNPLTHSPQSKLGVTASRLKIKAMNALGLASASTGGEYTPPERRPSAAEFLDAGPQISNLSTSNPDPAAGSSGQQGGSWQKGTSAKAGLGGRHRKDSRVIMDLSRGTELDRREPSGGGGAVSVPGMAEAPSTPRSGTSTAATLRKLRRSVDMIRIAMRFRPSNAVARRSTGFGGADGDPSGVEGAHRTVGSLPELSNMDLSPRIRRGRARRSSLDGLLKNIVGRSFAHRAITQRRRSFNRDDERPQQSLFDSGSEDEDLVGTAAPTAEQPHEGGVQVPRLPRSSHEYLMEAAFLTSANLPWSAQSSRSNSMDSINRARTVSSQQLAIGAAGAGGGLGGAASRSPPSIPAPSVHPSRQGSRSQLEILVGAPHPPQLSASQSPRSARSVPDAAGDTAGGSGSGGGAATEAFRLESLSGWAAGEGVGGARGEGSNGGGPSSPTSPSISGAGPAAVIVHTPQPSRFGPKLSGEVVSPKSATPTTKSGVTGAVAAGSGSAVAHVAQALTSSLYRSTSGAYAELQPSREGSYSAKPSRPPSIGEPPGQGLGASPPRAGAQQAAGFVRFANDPREGPVEVAVQVSAVKGQGQGEGRLSLEVSVPVTMTSDLELEELIQAISRNNSNAGPGAAGAVVGTSRNVLRGSGGGSGGGGGSLGHGAGTLRQKELEGNTSGSGYAIMIKSPDVALLTNGRAAYTPDTATKPPAPTSDPASARLNGATQQPGPKPGAPYAPPALSPTDSPQTPIAAAGAAAGVRNTQVSPVSGGGGSSGVNGMVSSESPVGGVSKTVQVLLQKLNALPPGLRAEIILQLSGRPEVRNLLPPAAVVMAAAAGGSGGGGRADRAQQHKPQPPGSSEINAPPLAASPTTSAGHSVQHATTAYGNSSASYNSSPSIGRSIAGLPAGSLSERPQKGAGDGGTAAAAAAAAAEYGSPSLRCEPGPASESAAPAMGGLTAPAADDVARITAADSTAATSSRLRATPPRKPSRKTLTPSEAFLAGRFDSRSAVEGAVERLTRGASTSMLTLDVGSDSADPAEASGRRLSAGSQAASSDGRGSRYRPSSRNPYQPTSTEVTYARAVSSGLRESGSGQAGGGGGSTVSSGLTDEYVMAERGDGNTAAAAASTTVVGKALDALDGSEGLLWPIAELVAESEPAGSPSAASARPCVTAAGPAMTASTSAATTTTGVRAVPTPAATTVPVTAAAAALAGPATAAAPAAAVTASSACVGVGSGGVGYPRAAIITTPSGGPTRFAAGEPPNGRAGYAGLASTNTYIGGSVGSAANHAVGANVAVGGANATATAAASNMPPGWSLLSYAGANGSVGGGAGGNVVRGGGSVGGSATGMVVVCKMDDLLERLAEAAMQPSDSDSIPLARMISGGAAAAPQRLAPAVPASAAAAAAATLPPAPPPVAVKGPGGASSSRAGDGERERSRTQQQQMQETQQQQQQQQILIEQQQLSQLRQMQQQLVEQQQLFQLEQLQQQLRQLQGQISGNAGVLGPVAAAAVAAARSDAGHHGDGTPGMSGVSPAGLADAAVPVQVPASPPTAPPSIVAPAAMTALEQQQEPAPTATASITKLSPPDTNLQQRRASTEGGAPLAPRPTSGSGRAKGSGGVLGSLMRPFRSPSSQRSSGAGGHPQASDHPTPQSQPHAQPHSQHHGHHGGLTVPGVLNKMFSKGKVLAAELAAEPPATAAAQPAALSVAAAAAGAGASDTVANGTTKVPLGAGVVSNRLPVGSFSATRGSLAAAAASLAGGGGGRVAAPTAESAEATPAAAASAAANSSLMSTSSADIEGPAASFSGLPVPLAVTSRPQPVVLPPAAALDPTQKAAALSPPPLPPLPRPPLQTTPSLPEAPAKGAPPGPGPGPATRPDVVMVEAAAPPPPSQRSALPTAAAPHPPPPPPPPPVPPGEPRPVTTATAAAAAAAAAAGSSGIEGVAVVDFRPTGLLPVRLRRQDDGMPAPAVPTAAAAAATVAAIAAAAAAVRPLSEYGSTPSVAAAAAGAEDVSGQLRNVAVLKSQLLEIQGSMRRRQEQLQLELSQAAQAPTPPVPAAAAVGVVRADAQGSPPPQPGDHAAKPAHSPQHPPQQHQAQQRQLQQQLLRHFEHQQQAMRQVMVALRQQEQALIQRQERLAAAAATRQQVLPYAQAAGEAEVLDAPCPDLTAWNPLPLPGTAAAVAAPGVGGGAAAAARDWSYFSPVAVPSAASRPPDTPAGFSVIENDAFSTEASTPTAASPSVAVPRSAAAALAARGCGGRGGVELPAMVLLPQADALQAAAAAAVAAAAATSSNTGTGLRASGATLSPGGNHVVLPAMVILDARSLPTEHLASGPGRWSGQVTGAAGLMYGAAQAQPAHRAGPWAGAGTGAGGAARRGLRLGVSKAHMLSHPLNLEEMD